MILRQKSVALCIGLALVFSVSAFARNVGCLRCEYLENPAGIDTTKPRLSWLMQSDQRGEIQTAYQIIVASTRELLARNQGDLWDSGEVKSDQSSLVKYGGAVLQSRMQCHWKVRVWNKDGKPSAWSRPAMWTMGLLRSEDWQAKWIGKDSKDQGGTLEKAQWIWFPEGDPAQSAPVGTRYFRRTIDLPPGQKIVSAICTATVDDAFALTVNGKQACVGNYWGTVKHLDVASFLQAGENKLFISATNASASPAGLIFSLWVELAGGAFVDVSDGQWDASKDSTNWSPAKVLGNYGMGPWGKVGSDERVLPAQYLRREFQVAKKVTRATAYVCGLGFFDLFLNGQKVSNHIMDPALSDYSKAAYYVTFDVTDQIRKGGNAIGVVLGNGRFFTPRPSGSVDYGFPKLFMQLEVEYADGTKTFVASDEKWRLTTDGPIRANNEYDGEIYDARKETPGWDCLGFDDAKWENASLVAAPGGKLHAQMIEPMRVTKLVRPTQITNPAPGVYLVDFGQNFYGAVRIKASAPQGTEVRMVSAYSLKPDGLLKTADNRSARCTDVYTFKGKGVETWNPRFKGQGFRRVQVTGFLGKLTADNFEGLVIHTDVKPAGTFECSNQLINRIHMAMLWDMRMFLRSAPLDPDRDERQAWMGDPAKDSESEAFNFNVAPFYTKWMDDVRGSQRPDGSIPAVAMYWEAGMGDGVEWPSVFTIIPDWFVDFYGDSRVAQNNYEAMRKWVLAMRRHELPDGTLRGSSYADWCDTSTMDGKVGENGSTPRELVSSAYQYHNYRIMERLAGKFGKPEDKAEFAGLAENLKLAFNKKFLDSKTHLYQGDTQCAYVLALQFGLVPEEQRAGAISNLVDNILVKHNSHLSVGLIGIQWLMQTLTDIGRPDVAWMIATQTTRPSWGYMISKGATTIWERWDTDTRDPGMNSEALLIQAGNLDAWFYQTLAGINLDESACKHIIIHPRLLGDLTWVKSHFDSPFGRVVSGWKLDGKKLTMNVTIPPNTTATVYVPAKSAELVTESGKAAGRVNGVKLVRSEDGAAIFEVAAGQYEFKSVR